MEAVALIITMVILIGGAIAWSFYADKKRREGLMAVAEELGLDFHPEGLHSVQNEVQGFQLFNRGRSRKMRFLIEGDTDEVQIALFDYQFTTGSGKNSHTHRQAVAYLGSPLIQAPPFSMRPEGLFDAVGGALGFQDIDFDSHPTFSKMFVLKGEEEPVRRFFQPQILEYFETKKGVSVEAKPGALIFYRPRVVLRDNTVKDLLGEAYEVFGVMVDSKGKG